MWKNDSTASAPPNPATGVMVEVQVQYVEIYVEKMYDLVKHSSRALDRNKKVPASLGARGLANAAKIVLDGLPTFQKVRALVHRW